MNASISSLSNQTIETVSVRSLLNSQPTNKNILFDNKFKNEKMNYQSKAILDGIILNNEEIIKFKEQLYNKIYDIALNQITINYKIKSFIIFEVPKSYLDSNYNWIECIKYIILKLKKSGFDIKQSNNFIKISWDKFKKNFYYETIK